MSVAVAGFVRRAVRRWVSVVVAREMWGAVMGLAGFMRARFAAVRCPDVGEWRFGGGSAADGHRWR